MKSEDRQFFNQFIEVIAILVLVAIGIYWTASSIGSSIEDKVDPRRVEVNSKDLLPEAMVITANIPIQETVSNVGPRSGETIFNEVGCNGCHKAGNPVGAPAVGDNAAWVARYSGDLTPLVRSVQVGKGKMPALGTEATEEEFEGAVVYILEKSGITVASAAAAAPEAPAPEAAAAVAPTPVAAPAMEQAQPVIVITEPAAEAMATKEAPTEEPATETTPAEPTEMEAATDE